MTLADILCRMVDNYRKIVVDVLVEKPGEIKEKYEVEPHAANYLNIPENIWEAKVWVITLYYDYLVICVSEEKGE